MISEGCKNERRPACARPSQARRHKREPEPPRSPLSLILSLPYSHHCHRWLFTMSSHLCDRCQVRFESAEGYHEHVRSSSRHHMCSVCNTDWESETALVRLSSCFLIRYLNIHCSIDILRRSKTAGLPHRTKVAVCGASTSTIVLISASRTPVEQGVRHTHTGCYYLVLP